MGKNEMHLNQPLEQSAEHKEEVGYINDFNELKSLGSLDGDGVKVSFQPFKRYIGKRHIGTVQLSESRPGAVVINFDGDLGGFTQPDGEYITEDGFEERKAALQIQIVK